jgi:hypothetical protein
MRPDVVVVNRRRRIQLVLSATGEIRFFIRRVAGRVEMVARKTRIAADDRGARDVVQEAVTRQR